MNSVKKKNFFTKFFPVPKFLTMPATGIDISDNSIHFIKLKDRKDGKILDKFGSAVIPDGIVSKGEIQDVEALTDILRKLKKDHDIDFVRASLPEEKAYLFQTQIPDNVLDKDIRNILEFKLEEYVPLSPSNAVFDYEILPKHTSSQKHLDVSVAVYPKQTIERYTSVFRNAGMTLLSLEIEGQAIARSVLKKGDTGTYMVVDFGKAKTGLSVVSDNILSFTSTLELEEMDITNAITKYLSVSEEEAIRIKNEDGLIKTRDNKELFSALMSAVESFKNEINKYSKYWKTRTDENDNRVDPIEKIILCGGNSNLAGLPEYLSASLGLPVERANVWINTRLSEDSVPELSKSSSLSYATSVGLGLRDTD